MADLLPEHPDFLWRNPDPKSSYDAVIVGGGGHGLATAYYLARNHGITRVAVLERGWIGLGKRARPRSHISWILQPGPAALTDGVRRIYAVLEESFSRTGA